jgi:hypothetical protein
MNGARRTFCLFALACSIFVAALIVGRPGPTMPSGVRAVVASRSSCSKAWPVSVTNWMPMLPAAVGAVLLVLMKVTDAERRYDAAVARRDPRGRVFDERE